jgi:hypothetical protein
MVMDDIMEYWEEIVQYVYQENHHHLMEYWEQIEHCMFKITHVAQIVINCVRTLEIDVPHSTQHHPCTQKQLKW